MTLAVFRIQKKRKPLTAESNLQLIHNNVRRPELLNRERDLGNAVALIRVPNQEFMLPVLQ